MDVNESLLKEFLEKMILIRGFEYKIIELARSGQIYGSVHLCVGEEASAVGSCLALEKDDYILPTHRGHGQSLAKGSDPNTLLAEIAAKQDGLCKGRVGSMHFFDRSNNNLGCQGILGAQFPIAIGVGLSIKLRKENRVAACFFGDGTSNQGTFFEGLNFADLWDLPILYVCINNLYGMGTHYANTCKIDIYEKARMFNMRTELVDGNDVVEAYKVSKELADHVRKEKRPALIQLNTYRWLGHSALDSRPYRPKEEIEAWKKKDPIKRFKDYLLKEKFSQKEIDAIEDKANKILDEAHEFTLNSKLPEFTSDMEI
jgi:acetoin:2,6-dichlorophenolindophenol oxidoreductase subunit alpha